MAQASKEYKVKTLNDEQIKNVKGGLIPLFAVIAAAFSAYEGGKIIGKDIIKGIDASSDKK